MPAITLLPRPERPYRALVADLEALGWAWAGEPQRLPLLRGEPEWVDWIHAAGGRLRYTFNPAIRLRELEIDAPEPLLAPLRRLPLLGRADLPGLLAATEPEAILRGLYAVRALGEDALRGAVEALRAHPDTLVRETTEAVLAGLAPSP